MEVRFVSSLTSEDEERYAPAVLAALAGMLDHTNLAYTIQIRTSGDKSFHHTHTATGAEPLNGSASRNAVAADSDQARRVAAQPRN